LAIANDAEEDDGNIPVPGNAPYVDAGLDAGGVVPGVFVALVLVEPEGENEEKEEKDGLPELDDVDVDDEGECVGVGLEG